MTGTDADDRRIHSLDDQYMLMTAELTSRVLSAGLWCTIRLRMVDMVGKHTPSGGVDFTANDCNNEGSSEAIPAASTWIFAMRRRKIDAPHQYPIPCVHLAGIKCHSPTSMGRVCTQLWGPAQEPPGDAGGSSEDEQRDGAALLGGKPGRILGLFSMEKRSFWDDLIEAFQYWKKTARNMKRDYLQELGVTGRQSSH
ncbi:hypothetical protein TURU_041620 [Turdus rufiventris]|nr:hypothetical protein TURU_041620 [Turdus rufiventris]